MVASSKSLIKKIRVLVVDDSALARKLITAGLSMDPHIEVIATAHDPNSAWNVLIKERPDVITLDVEMPGIDGVTFLKKYMAERPTPTVMVSALTERGTKITLDALEAGAIDIVTKPKVGVVDGLPLLMGDLCERVKAAARVNVQRFALRRSADPKPQIFASHCRPYALHETTDRVIAIGASAGGVAAIARIIPLFSPAAPGIVIVQHMPAGFTTSFAERLKKLSAMQVKEASDGDRVRQGLVLLAPGGERHMEIRRSGGNYRVALVKGRNVSGHCPSVNVLFRSLASCAEGNVAAALLTGMGDDGAEGLLAIRRAGGSTFAQDEQTSVVFGMPAAAWAIGAAEELLPLETIPMRLMKEVGR